jgi:hypothetical protein
MHPILFKNCDQKVATAANAYEVQSGVGAALPGSVTMISVVAYALPQ